MTAEEQQEHRIRLTFVFFVDTPYVRGLSCNPDFRSGGFADHDFPLAYLEPK